MAVLSRLFLLLVRKNYIGPTTPAVFHTAKNGLLINLMANLRIKLISYSLLEKFLPVGRQALSISGAV